MVSAITKMAEEVSVSLKNHDLLLKGESIVRNLSNDCPIQVTRNLIVPEIKFEDDIVDFSANYLERQHSRILSGLDELRDFLVIQLDKLSIVQRFFEVKGNNRHVVSRNINFNFFARDVDKVKTPDADCVFCQVEDLEAKRAYFRKMTPIEKCWYSFKSRLNRIFENEIYSLNLSSKKFLSSRERIECYDHESGKIIDMIMRQSARDEFGAKVYTDDELMNEIKRAELKLTELRKTTKKADELKEYASKKDIERSEKLQTFYTNALFDDTYDPLVKEAKRRGLM